jgi:pimeloyl-ACP methyl ester carboxylesterase
MPPGARRRTPRPFHPPANVHRVPLEAKGIRSFPPPLKGALKLVPFRSDVLEDNPLEDPAERTLLVYTPPSGRTEGLPLLVYLPGFMGAGWMVASLPRVLAESLVQRVDRLLRTGTCPEVVLLAPDCQTTLGGSQYLNSTATGRYEDHVMDELLPWARETYHTGPVGLFGQSSGGFGALSLAMNRPGEVQGVGSSAGDMAFHLSYTIEFPHAIREIRRAGGVEAFLRYLFQNPPPTIRPQEPLACALELIAMSACYSPVEDAPGAFELPFDPQSGVLQEAVWERWLRLDPCQRVRRPAEQRALARLEALELNASGQDEWGLDVGSRIFMHHAWEARLPAAFEEFPGGHFEHGPRLENLVLKLARALGVPARGSDRPEGRSRETGRSRGESS